MINQNLAGECFIENESTTNGGTATFTGTFVAESPGISTVTMEATDSDGAVTTVDIVSTCWTSPPSIDVIGHRRIWHLCGI